MRSRTVLIALLLAAALVPATAVAGGWATVELSSTPDGLAPGKPWNVELTVLQHGRTPLEGVEPSIVVTDGRGAERTVAATPSGVPGVYRASVVFPSAGTWEYVVDDGFSQRHSYPPVTIGAPGPAAPPDDDPFPWAAFIAALAAGAVAAAATSLLVRRRAAPAR